MELYDYFNRLKSVLFMLEEVELKWLPGKSNKYRGMVSNDGRTIFVFDTDEGKASETLLHEILSLLIVKMAYSISADPAVSSDTARMGKEIYLVEMLRKFIPPEELAKKDSREQIIQELKRLGCKNLTG